MTRRALAFAMLPGIAFLTAVFVLGTMGYRINVTPSLPMGVWQRVERDNARYVEFCMPEGAFAALVVQRGYLPTGRCPHGVAPLLKPVVARAGDEVDVTTLSLDVNGHRVLDRAAEKTDSRGRPLPAVEVGHSVVAPGRLWVISTYHPRSLDSRYFGPILESSVTAGMRPVWVITGSTDSHALAY